MLKTVIKLQNISFGYPSLKLIQNLNLEIFAGDYIGILGPNGGGKSTLLKLILGLVKPEKGTSFLFEKEVRGFRDWYKVGYVPQYLERKNKLPATVWEVVSSSMNSLFNLSISQKKLINETLELLKLKNIQNKLIFSLSGGQLQRVFIARSLVHKPQLLILDEPTTGVDWQSQIDFYKFIKTLNIEQNMTILMVTHDIEIIKTQTKKALLLDGNPDNAKLINSVSLNNNKVSFSRQH
jgi:zinc transport system ATP-binding protein